MSTDMQTVRQSIKETLRQSPGDDRINRAIAEALRELRSEETHFTVSTFTLDTVVGQGTYARDTLTGSDVNKLPGNFWGVLGRRLSLDDNKSGKHWYTMEEVSPAYWDSLQDEYADDQGTPRFYRFWDLKLSVLPLPDSIDQIRGRYCTDKFVIYPAYDGATWDYVDEDGVSINTDTYTNKWFDEGLGMVTNRACYHLCLTTEQNQKRAQDFLRAYTEALAQLRRQEGKLKTIGRTVPWLAGYSDGTGHDQWLYWGKGPPP